MILYKNQPLAYTIFRKPVRQAQVVNTKTLDRKIRTPKPPAADHPWRRYGRRLNGAPIPEQRDLAANQWTSPLSTK